MTELEQKAREYADSKCGTLCDANMTEWICCRNDYLAGATENGIQWHDLRKDPKDLPEAQPLNWVLAVYDNGTLWCRARREKCVDGVYWVNSFHNVIHDVVMWAKVEIPQFKE